jgi:hypothetical protein
MQNFKKIFSFSVTIHYKFVCSIIQIFHSSYSSALTTLSSLTVGSYFSGTLLILHDSGFIAHQKRREIVVCDDSKEVIRLILWAKKAETFDVKEGTYLEFKKLRVNSFDGMCLSSADFTQWKSSDRPVLSMKELNGKFLKYNALI